jgi:histidine ammonia-lyase
MHEPWWMSDAVYRSLRKAAARYADDRPFATDIDAAIDFLRRQPPR